ncbi:hypothetical protein P3T76_010994 [Phytophthora citrophthora]|uniref:C2 domain-containing protein n=1 Tax=Phytophthora citrophthora TaxID=4793 RepID=A0AAD9LFW8_9STRA|nr:hypothetical protein P3T76_010994 [Phytophthora citrophthora]
MLAGETDLSAFLKRTLPVVSVDGRFPIENPFTGHTSGYLKGRVCFGTAQQILTWSKTIRAVIELQGIIRGVSSRQHFGGFIPAKPRANFMLNRSLSEDLSSVDNRSEFQSTTPTVTPGIRVTGLDDNTADEMFPQSSECRAVLRSICFQIRENWRSATRQELKQRGWSSAPLLGCELQGQLVLTGDKEQPAKVKGVSFALWWDSADSKLNSSFTHVFRSNRAHQIVDNVDGEAVGPQSQVLFALYVENGFFGSQSRETAMGEARLNLNEAICKNSAASKTTGRIGEVIDVDIPIEWSTNCSGFQKLAPCVPLRISYQMSLLAIPETILVDRLGEDYNDHVVDSEHDVHSDELETHLKPASIALSFCLFSVTGFEHLLDENRRHLFAADLADMNLLDVHLRDILNNSRDALPAFFEIKVCLGTELDEREQVLELEVESTRDTTTRVFTDNGKWFKHWQSPAVLVRVSGGQVEDLKKLSMLAYMLLNPVTVATLQKECAYVTYSFALKVFVACSQFVSERVFIEEGRNLVVNDVGPTPRLYATFDMAKRGVTPAFHELDASSGKRTESKGGNNPRWNCRETLRMDNVDWQRFSLEVSVWMEGKPPQPSRPGLDMFVGMVLVDLSLFSRGWSDIDGWYHIQDAQYLTRGQIKIRVRNLSVESSRSLTAAARSFELKSPLQSALDQHEIESVTDKAGPTQISLGDNEHAVQDSSEGEFGQDKDDFDKSTDVPFDSNIISGNEENSFESSQRLDGSVVDNLAWRNMDTPTDNGPPSNVVNPTSSVSDDSVDLDIDTGYFQPMTLASFGIDEMELSPIDYDKLSFDENEHKVIAEVATSPPQAGSTPFRSASQKQGLSNCSSSISSSGDEGHALGYIDLESLSSDSISENVGERLEEHAAAPDIELVANSAAETLLDRGMDAEDNTVFLRSDQREAVQRDRVVYAEKDVQVDPFELEQIEMVSCSVQTDGNLSEKDIYTDSGEGNDQLKDIISTVAVGCDPLEDMDSPNEVYQFAEKAIQVDPSELGLQIEMVTCSVQTIPEESIQIEPDEVVPEDGYDTKEDLYDKDVFESSNAKPEEDIASDSSVSKSPGTGESEIYQDGSGSDIKLQNEMLGLVYEMLREMRDACFDRKVEQPASPRKAENLNSLGEKLKVETVPLICSVIARSETTPKRCSCPSSPISHVPSARKGSLDNSAVSVSFLSQDAVMSNDSSENRLGVSITRDLATSRKIENVANRTQLKSGHTPERTSPQLSLFRRSVGRNTENKPRSFDGRKLAAVPHTSRRDTASYRDTIDQFAPSQHAVKRSYSSYKNQLDENDHHSPAHSLFARDSETERIARIMQGSMKYWMKDDSSSSGEEKDNEDDDTSVDCYF